MVPPADRLSYHSYCKRELTSLSQNLEEREQKHNMELRSVFQISTLYEEKEMMVGIY